MRILSVYSQRTLSVLRRVIAPFSVLSTRGHTFSFMQVAEFHAAMAVSYDVTVLPNWILQDSELEDLQQQAAQGSVFAYDLAHYDLLQIDRVLETIRCCRLVTVPNEYLAKEVKIAVPGMKVEVVPSTLDIPYLMTAHSYPRAMGMNVACVGSFDWGMVKDALVKVKEKRGEKITFYGDAGAVKVLGDLVIPVDLSFNEYPAFLRMCAFALLPTEREMGQDFIWQHEFGLLCKPSIHHLRGTDQWTHEILSLAGNDSIRSSEGWQAHTAAKEKSAVRLADRYLKVYRQVAQLSSGTLH